MMKLLLRLIPIMPGLLSGFSLPADAQSLQQILASDAPYEMLDALPHDVRPRLTGELAERFGKAAARNDTTEVTELARALCLMSPWTTGNTARDDELQATFWREIAKVDDPASDSFRYLDCASANRVGFLRDKVLLPMISVQQSVCGGALEALSDLARTTKGGIARFDADTVRMEEKAGARIGSLYPPRNVFRNAALDATLAAVDLRADYAAGRKRFAELAAALAAYGSGTDLAKVRGGWRIHNDMELYAEFYRWLGEGEGSLDLARFRAWPAVRSDPAVFAMIPPSEQGRIPSDFVDQVYVNRLLPTMQYGSNPGEAEKAAECAAWRDRSYDIRRFSTAMETCGVNGPPRTFDALRQLDSCILQYDADDWRLDYASIKGTSADARKRIHDEAERFARLALGRAAPDFSETVRSRLLEIEVRAVSGWSVAYSTGEFTTAERAELTQLFDTIRSMRLKPLFRRPTQY